MSGDHSDSELDEESFVLYRDRPEWSDIDPISLDEGPNPVIAIAYSEVFKDVFGYFRAIVVANERSERAFELTKSAAELNAANYTVWQYRRLLLEDLSKSYVDELAYCRNVIEGNPKNYQVWHHRQCVVDKLQDPSKELRFTENILSNDPKNYHAWTHRQWAISKFRMFDQELPFVERLLEEDICNNSAWNHRFFVIKQFRGFTSDVVLSEVAFTLDAIRKLPANESSWSYLRGVLEQTEEGVGGHQAVLDLCQELIDSGNKSAYLLDFMIGIKENLLEKAGEDRNQIKKFVQEIVDLCKTLKEVDIIRKAYWDYVASSTQAQYSQG